MTNDKNLSLVLHEKRDLRLEERSMPPIASDEVCVRLAWGGICGTDLHFYNHGGVGALKIQHPFTPGHELSGKIFEIGREVNDFSEGEAVTIHPAEICRHCDPCREGRPQLCENVSFLGSIAKTPHIDGGFRQFMVVKAHQLRKIPDDLPLDIAALSEPLSVALHAISRAGGVSGRSILVQGCGPIGMLIITAARLKEAKDIVAVDLSDYPLELAKQMGANKVINASNQTVDDQFDIVFEASGATPALATALNATKTGGTVVQVGLFGAGEVSAPLAQVVRREINYIGSWRFHYEFDEAIEMLRDHKSLFERLISHRFDFVQFGEAFEMACDRKSAMKVLLKLNS